MSKPEDDLDELFADLDASGDLVDLTASQTEALRRAAENRRRARKEAQ